MSVQRILLVHGYSVHQLNAYGRIPALLAQQGYPIHDIYLSAYVSLDDRVTCDDLAVALEAHLRSAGITDDMLQETAVVCHSTGAIVTRRWILNRLNAQPPSALPSHLITLAGANHGSSLAQVGQTAIARVFRGLVEHAQVGERVLADLDYGSTFLWTLNTEWLESWNAGRLGSLCAFAMGGDQHWVDEPGFPEIPGWQFLEPGSDSIVRVSGANLNYSVVAADEATGRFRRASITPPCAHLVVHGFTHGGILGGIQDSSAPPFRALLDALAVERPGYEALRQQWAATTAAWSAQYPSQVNSTIVFRLRDESGRPIDDSWILLQDAQKSAGTVSDSLLPHQPIQNGTEPSVVSFYVNSETFRGFHPHTLHIDARSGSPNIDYRSFDYTLSPNDEHLVQPNEFTYVEVDIPRDVAGTYTVLPYDPARDVNKTWPPLPT